MYSALPAFESFAYWQAAIKRSIPVRTALPSFAVRRTTVAEIFALEALGCVLRSFLRRSHTERATNLRTCCFREAVCSVSERRMRSLDLRASLEMTPAHTYSRTVRTEFVQDRSLQPRQAVTRSSVGNIMMFEAAEHPFASLKKLPSSNAKTLVSSSSDRVSEKKREFLL